ncbi:hypothetical protein SAMN00120144_3886 [Hymenobacter roseosalivarius DSM 11622]|uniref:Uncharacterized protein n=1 Tax=Hymenobacter roseosalivarius DSM 11622 TaxID=645990 RepID=A0A1W1UG73_9BACT|nr:hypothetical protein SAMN00120144_3886 [Hymenobacter roseosalivarius DSM 11622]
MGRGFFCCREQGIQLLAHGRRQVMGQLGGELLLDRAEGLGDEARQGRIGWHLPAMGSDIIGRGVKNGHWVHLLAGKMRHLLAHGGFGLLDGPHAKLLQNLLTVVEASGLIVALPLDVSQVVALLHVRLVGQQKSVSRKEAPRGFEVADLEHEATSAMRSQQRVQELGGPVRQGEKELALRMIESRRLVKRAPLGRIK